MGALAAKFAQQSSAPPPTKKDPGSQPKVMQGNKPPVGPVAKTASFNPASKSGSVSSPSSSSSSSLHDASIPRVDNELAALKNKKFTELTEDDRGKLNQICAKYDISIDNLHVSIWIEHYMKDKSLNQSDSEDILKETTPITRAILSPKNPAGIVRALLEFGYDLNEIGPRGLTPFALAIQNGVSDLLPILKRLGASTEGSWGQGLTPLSYASQEGNMEAVEFLLKLKADPNAISSNGYTPLQVAVLNDDVEIMKLLIENGANPNLLDRNRKTLLEFAKENINPESIIFLNALFAKQSEEGERKGSAGEQEHKGAKAADNSSSQIPSPPLGSPSSFNASSQSSMSSSSSSSSSAGAVKRGSVANRWQPKGKEVEKTVSDFHNLPADVKAKREALEAFLAQLQKTKQNLQTEVIPKMLQEVKALIQKEVATVLQESYAKKGSTEETLAYANMQAVQLEAGQYFGKLVMSDADIEKMATQDQDILKEISANPALLLKIPEGMTIQQGFALLYVFFCYKKWREAMIDKDKHIKNDTSNIMNYYHYFGEYHKMVDALLPAGTDFSPKYLIDYCKIFPTEEYPASPGKYLRALEWIHARFQDSTISHKDFTKYCEEGPQNWMEIVTPPPFDAAGVKRASKPPREPEFVAEYLKTIKSAKPAEEKKDG